MVLELLLLLFRGFLDNNARRSTKGFSGLDHLNDSEAECFVFLQKKNTERFVEGKKLVSFVRGIIS